MPKRAQPCYRFLRNARNAGPSGIHPYFHSPSFAMHELAVDSQPCSGSTDGSAGMIDLVNSATLRRETRGRIFLYRTDLSTSYQRIAYGSKAVIPKIDRDPRATPTRCRAVINKRLMQRAHSSKSSRYS